jgi:hypothetical protein
MPLARIVTDEGNGFELLASDVAIKIADWARPLDFVRPFLTPNRLDGSKSCETRRHTIAPISCESSMCPKGSPMAPGSKVLVVATTVVRVAVAIGAVRDCSGVGLYDDFPSDVTIRHREIAAVEEQTQRVGADHHSKCWTFRRQVRVH